MTIREHYELAAAVVILLTACGPTSKVVPPGSTPGVLGIRVQPILRGLYALTTDFARMIGIRAKNTKSTDMRLVEFASNYCAKLGKSTDAEGFGTDIGVVRLDFKCVETH